MDSEGVLYDSKKGSNSFISALKFYANGNVNDFRIEKNTINNIKILDPLISGYRGKVVSDNNIHFFVPIDQTYRIMKKKYTFKISGDTLLLSHKKDRSKYIYLREKLSQKTQNFNANW